MTTTSPDGTVCVHDLADATGTVDSIWQVITITMSADGSMTLAEQ